MSLTTRSLTECNIADRRAVARLRLHNDDFGDDDDDDDDNGRDNAINADRAETRYSNDNDNDDIMKNDSVVPS